MKKKITITLICFASLIIYLILGNKFHIYLACPIKKLTGLYCPGCGITRMFYSLITFNFYQAFRYNPLLFCSLPIFLFFGMNALISKKEPLYNKIPTKYWMIIIIIFITYGLLRNIPMFDFLAPTIIK